MPRVIDAEKLAKYKASGISDLTEWQKGWNDAIDMIMEEAPTVDAVEVVRCKDCKFGEYDEDFPNQYYCPNWGCAFRSDWYCADGKRREDE